MKSGQRVNQIQILITHYRKLFVFVSNKLTVISDVKTNVTVRIRVLKLQKISVEELLYHGMEVITLARLLAVIYHLIQLNIYSSYMENMCV